MEGERNLVLPHGFRVDKREPLGNGGLYLFLYLRDLAQVGNDVAQGRLNGALVVIGFLVAVVVMEAQRVLRSDPVVLLVGNDEAECATHLPDRHAVGKGKGLGIGVEGGEKLLVHGGDRLVRRRLAVIVEGDRLVTVDADSIDDLREVDLLAQHIPAKLMGKRARRCPSKHEDRETGG